MAFRPTRTRPLATGARTALALSLALALAACSDSSDRRPVDPEPPEPPPPVQPPEPVEDRAYYILPPGNFGGLPTGDHSLDQLPLYDGLTPLRGDVTDADIEQYFLPEDLQPIGETVDEPAGRDGVTISYDEWGVPHITGNTREDLAFGAGWTAARDRDLLVSLGRGPARVAVADVPGIDAFGLVTSGQSFIPSEATEQLVTDQVDLIIEEFGEEGEAIIAEAQAYADGYNAYKEATFGANPVPYTVNDVIATSAFIGSIFGAGGGREARNSEFLAQLVEGLGQGQAQLAWEDVMLFDDPEAPTTLAERFDYGPFTGGDVVGSAVIDAGSVVSIDAVQPAPGVEAQLSAQEGLTAAADAPNDREASNWLIINGSRSDNTANLAVMGPQLGYYYPEIVHQIRFSGAGIEAQGAAVPGMSLYILIGRTENYAWSLTSAGNDVRDVYAEELCEPDGSEPTRESLHYIYEGECIPYEIFDAGLLNGEPVIYPVSVHGPMIGTATSEGKPIGLTRKRSTFGRDGLNLAALRDMTEGDAATPEQFFESANKFGFTFNWGYINRETTAFFSSGLLPERPAGLDRRRVTWGNGDYEWQGFLSQEEHPHGTVGPDGHLLNWNNQAAPGFMHGDGTPYGSVHRVELFDQFPEKVDLAGVVSVMNRSGTEDVRSPAWPVVSEVLRGGDAPSELAGAVADLMDAWVEDDAPRLDTDNDGFNDHAGPTIMDALWGPLVESVVRPVLGDMTEALDDYMNLGGNHYSSGGNQGSSIVDKDLRTLLGREVEGEFNLQYCGAGSLDDCRDSLWQVIDEVSQALAAEYGSEDPASWLQEGQTVGFAPGLIPDRFRATNRPTFQQVLQFGPGIGTN